MVTFEEQVWIELVEAESYEEALLFSVLLVVPSFIAMWLFHVIVIDTTEVLQLLWKEYRSAVQDKKKLAYV